MTTLYTVRAPGDGEKEVAFVDDSGDNSFDPEFIFTIAEQQFQGVVSLSDLELKIEHSTLYGHRLILRRKQ